MQPNMTESLSTTSSHAATKPLAGAHCEVCKTLTISRLVQCARVELAELSFMPDRPDAYLQHHDSVEALEGSALAGCSLCTLFVDTLKGYEGNGDWSISSGTWLGSKCDPEQSLFSIVKQPSTLVPTTDIKLCLASGRSNVPEIMDGKTLLDTMILQVGPTQKVEKDPELNGDFDAPDFPQLLFKLTVPRDYQCSIAWSSGAVQLTRLGHPIEVDGYRIGRYQIPPQVDSDDCFDICRGWLHECETSHTSCVTDAPPELPSRVVDVGTYPEDVKILQANGAKAQYVALSHCWGGPISPLLSSETIVSFKDLLPYSDLPANFQDAITITRRLGIQYIWIDSLCIIQDSKQDWEEQSKKMAAIYRDSTVTISALASEGSKRGILTPKHKLPLTSTEPESATIALTTGDTPSSQGLQIQRLDFDEETLSGLDTSGPLALRGWCLQESMLPPRQLYFGLEQIYWRCPNGYSSADGSTNGLRVPEDRFEHISTILHKEVLRSHDLSAPLDIIAIMDNYYAMVQQYSQRSLTYASDKLPAFSGISSQLQSVVGGTYIAGIWTSHITTGLLWEGEMRTSKHVTPYRAPSWSWAVTDESVLYSERELRNLHPSAMRLIDHHVTLKNPNNPYGEIECASITIQARTLTFVRSEQHIKGTIDESDYWGTAKLDEEPPKHDGVADLPPDYIRTSPVIFIMKDGESTYLLSVNRSYGGKAVVEVDFDLVTDESYLAIMVHIDEANSRPGEARRANGLIVKPRNGSAEGEYERVGLFTFWDFKLLWLEDWEWKTMTLV